MKSERRKLIDQLDKLVKDKAKKRDNYTCQHCGRQVEGSNAHGSHVIPISKGYALRWDIDNIKTLCFKCHMGWWHKHPLEASEWFETKFPQRYEYLKKHENDVVKYSVSDLQEIYETLSNL